ncbi:MAG: hypothetical protein SFV54_17970 [Bryobacteraceae bacterium]|nr:hypothetical protein [Bryobacteraceae bacterium]
MSRYSREPLEFAGLKTIPIRTRGGKVRVEDFARPYQKGGGIGGLVDSLPRILAAESLRAVLDALRGAKAAGRPILWGLGGHVIKCGLAPLLLDLTARRYATGFVLNGAASIHDFEIAIAGCTSEDVESVLPNGRFGTAEETGREINEAIREGVAAGIGMGEALGRRLDAIADPAFAGSSLLLGAYRSAVPVTVHVAVGTDTPHTYPEADGAAIGAATHHDFRLLCRLVTELGDGGVYMNVGSAVVLPEVFLKAVSVVRNLGYPLLHFTTVNLDFLQHYRPRVNVVERPHAKAGGRGYSLTGHHELLLPLIAAALVEGED